MQDGPLPIREDVTVSLDKELIDRMVGIAEIRGITLSALVRDILGAFCRAYQAGSDWTKGGSSPAVTTGSTAESRSGIVSGEQLADILSRISRHDELISSLHQRVSVLELTDGIVARIPVSVDHPALQTTLASTPGGIAEVIDTDAPDPSGVSDEALVRIRKPISPVITSVDLNSMGRINPDQDYSMTEAAAQLGISASTIRKYVKDGRISARKIGRSSVFKGRDLITYLANNR